MKTLKQCALCATALVAMTRVGAETLAEDLKPGQWRIDAKQMRFSALLDGTLVDDEKSAVRHETDRIDSWARSQWRASWHPQAALWGLQWAAFADAQLHVDGVAGRAAARINNKLAGSPGTRYPFGINSLKYRRLGMSASKAFAGANNGVWPHQWTVGTSVFAVDQFKSIDASGVLEDRAEDNLKLKASVIENEMGKQSTFIRPEKALGYGMTADISALWGQLDSSFFRLSVQDLGPQVRLSQLLGTDQAINTDTASFDADGYIQFASAISGRYTNRHASFRVKPEIRMEGGWQKQPGRRWLGQLVKHGTRQEAALVFQAAIAGYRLDLGAHALFNMPNSISLGLAASNWGMNWQADRISPSKARIWSLSGYIAF